MAHRKLIENMLIDFDANNDFSIVCDDEFKIIADEFWKKMICKRNSLHQHPENNSSGKKDDFMIVISRRGRASHIIDVVKSAMKEKVKVYAICCDFRSPLALLSENAIVLDDDEFFRDEVLQILDLIYEKISDNRTVGDRKKSPVLDETAFLNPMKGMIIKLKVNVGDSIKKGDVLYVIEAMKMELDVKSDRDGVISRISVEKGDFVEYRDAVMNFE